MKNLAIAIALVAASASSAVFADGGRYEYPDTFKSTVTRAQVAAEAQEAQRLGLIGGGEVTRQATSAELRAIQIAGERAVARQVAGAAGAAR